VVTINIPDTLATIPLGWVLMFVLFLVIRGLLEWGRESLRIRREARAHAGDWEYLDKHPEVLAYVLEHTILPPKTRATATKA
jgi:hypothetical protein